MSESDGKGWTMIKPETGEHVSVRHLSDKVSERDDPPTAVDKLWGRVCAVMEQHAGPIDAGVFAVVLDAIRTAEGLGRKEGQREGRAAVLAQLTEAADGYQRRARAIRCEAETVDNKAEALTSFIVAARREMAP